MKIAKGTVANPVSPAGFIVEEAEKQNETLRHENLGFLSRAHGFMPIKPPLLAFPKTHEAWDQIATQLSYWYRCVQLRYELERMPLLNASESFLADQYLFRASSFLCILLQAYYRAEVGEPEHIPEAIMKPLQQVSQRLGRTEVGITINDLMTYNWRL
ncbi:MAG: indoleamine 2,3-dioxygenase, partial [Gammaproteobacteria bacterium]|nr:indoleamine 2,3-dioxygenase [Gammaproteobacteria bacterium]